MLMDLDLNSILSDSDSESNTSGLGLSLDGLDCFTGDHYDHDDHNDWEK